MAQTFEDESLLCDAVVSRVRGSRTYVVTIDGKDGAGKSTLARSLAEHLGAEYIELDHFLIENKGGYLDCIRYDELSAAIADRQTSGQHLVVEGICVLDVLERIGVAADLTVYVKRIRPNGLWLDGIRYFDRDKTADEVIAERIEGRRRWAMLEGFDISEDEDLSREGADEEIIRYHFRRKPDETSDIILNRREKDE